ncbi:MAG: GGDEF domain-containing protein [Syntrophobacteraceae bacterium]|nr:GGDEF domain-containing protein [Syntrophobacteraceae bacterium]
MKSLFSFFAPGGILVLLAVVLTRKGLLSVRLPIVSTAFPLLVLVAGLLLGWRFNRSRSVFALLMIGTADRLLAHFENHALSSTDAGKLAFYAAATLLPINFAILSLLKERGITSPSGLRRICFILAQPAALFMLWHQFHRPSVGYLEHSLIQATLFQYASAQNLPRIAVVAAILGFCTLAFRYYRVRGPMESGFLWALTAVYCGLLLKGPGALSTFYFATAGLILIVSVVEASYAMAFNDELTGLRARRSLDEFMLRTSGKYTVAMLDIDFFKKFNDRYGHDVGDEVLRMVASKISEVSGGGKPFRYGGEEFTVVFPGKSRQDTLPHLEQLRSAIHSAGFVIRARSRPRKKPDNPKPSRAARKKVALTISIGVAERDTEHSSPREVIKAADRALYRAKKGGRNRVST